jgi:hypothetical protein
MSESSAYTTRNVLTSDPLISSLDRHNGWSMTILWQKMIVKMGRRWWSSMTNSLRSPLLSMTILDHHNGYDDIISSWANWGGHISNPIWHTHGRRPHQESNVVYTWHTRGRHVNQKQPGPFQWSIWAKPNNSNLFSLGLGLPFFAGPWPSLGQYLYWAI